MTLAFGIGLGVNFPYPNGGISDFLAGLIIGTLIGAILATFFLAVLSRTT